MTANVSLLFFGVFLLKTGPCEDVAILSSVYVKSRWPPGERLPCVAQPFAPLPYHILLSVRLEGV